MRIGKFVILVVIAAVILFSKPWEKPERLDQAICNGNVFWSFAYLYRGGELNSNIENGDFNTTPLLSALDNTGCPKILPHFWARALVWLGADVNLPNSGGYTPLMMAVGESDTSSVQFLLSKGARVADRDQSGNSAVDIARNLKNEHIIALLEQAK